MQLPSKKAQIVIGVILVSVLCFFVYEASAQFRGKETALKKLGASIGIGSNSNENNSNLPRGLWQGASTTDETIDPETAKYLDLNNVTNTIAKNLSMSLLAKDASGGLEQASDEEIISDALKDIKIDIKVTQYNQNQISTFSPKNKDEIKDYANRIAQIYREQGDKLVNRKDFPSNEEAIAFYQAVAEEMTKVPVPIEIAQAHLDLINNFSASYSVLTEINGYQNDPAKGVLSIKTFEEIEAARGETVNQLINYFKINGIIFEKTDAGYTWYQTVSI